MRKARGFTLIEIVVVLLIVGIIIAMAAAVTRGVSAGQKRSLTGTRLATVDLALMQYVQQRKRLPCPAVGTTPGTDPNAGLEGPRDGTGCTGNQANGVAPWRELALSEAEASDGWDRRLTYRVSPLLAADNGMDLSWCDPAGGTAVFGANNSCSATCSSSAMGNCTTPSFYLQGKGLVVRNAAGTATLMDPAGTPHTGAAYVLISPGESGGGGYLNSGVLSSSNTTDSDIEKLHNYADLTLVGAGYFVDDSPNENPGAAHFDDIVSRPSVMSVATKAGLAPRSH